MKATEFYIGWQTKSPLHLARFVRSVVIGLIMLALLTGTFLSVKQRRFSTAVFEFGTLTTVTGVYNNDPVPMIKVKSQRDFWGHTTDINIPLVGFGKSGAEGTIQQMEKLAGRHFQFQTLTLRGTLLYHDGKLLMQIDSNEQPLVKIDTSSAFVTSEKKELGTLLLKGEIVDPKCFFGVMKPGMGKVHKDCAIRCILGGIPPVLKVTDLAGNNNFYLLCGANGEKMNELVKDYIAEPVCIRARAVQEGDWIILYCDPAGINRISKRDLLYQGSAGIACQ